MRSISCLNLLVNELLIKKTLQQFFSLMMFEKYGDFWTMQNLWWIFLIVLAIIVMLYFFISNKRKQKNRERRWQNRENITSTTKEKSVSESTSTQKESRNPPGTT